MYMFFRITTNPTVTVCTLLIESVLSNNNNNNNNNNNIKRDTKTKITSLISGLIKFRVNNGKKSRDTFNYSRFTLLGQTFIIFNTVSCVVTRNSTRLT